ncbi:phosphotransferase family protein [Amycolatopsis sacchari]|uniref:phosphotransferase family protein n=1 Tax=Amycolatopsis sacchari TaxID=115433 RepID=UPI003EBF2DCE
MAHTAKADIALDLGTLGRLLRRDGIDVAGELTATRVGLGQSNLTYLVEDRAGGRWIVRRPPRGHLLASAHDVLREYRILEALSGTGVPVPRTVAGYRDDRLAETPVVVMEYVNGLVVDRMEVARSLDNGTRAAIGPSLARTLADVHRADIDAVGLGELASRAPYAARQLKRWSRQWAESRTGDLPRLDALTELLRRRMPEQTEVTLVHGDFHLRNVILTPDGGAVSAVLDWELGTLGDPLADLGSFLAYWPEAGDGPTQLFAASALPGFASRAELADAYLEASGRARADLDYWHAFGLWKIAIIAEGVLRRALDEPRNAAEGGPATREAVSMAVERAWAVAEGAGLTA